MMLRIERMWLGVGLLVIVLPSCMPGNQGIFGPNEPRTRQRAAPQTPTEMPAPENQVAEESTVTAPGEPAAQAAPAPIVSGPSQVSINGKVLTQSELQQLSATIGTTPAPGKYWYDPTCGLYGLMGHGAGGVIQAGLPFSSPATDVSRGRSGILVNGREITGAEATFLIRVLGGNPQTPAQYRGQYTLDASGNLLRSDGTPMGNIVQAARAREGGGSSNWSRGNASGGGNASCNWVSFKDSSGSTYSSVTSGCD